MKDATVFDGIIIYQPIKSKHNNSRRFLVQLTRWSRSSAALHPQQRAGNAPRKLNLCREPRRM